MSQPIEKPNYTQIPNVLLDEWITELGAAEFKVACAIARQTFGFHREAHVMSLTYLMEKTGLSRNAVVSALKALLQKCLIERRVAESSYAYALVIENDQSSKMTSHRNAPEVVIENDSYKESTKEKESADAEPPQKRKRQRQRDPMFDALVAVCRLDPQTAGSWIGGVKKQLAQTDYTPEEVLAFGEVWYQRDFPGGRSDGKPPNPTSVVKYIHWVRETPPEPEPEVVVAYNDALAAALQEAARGE